jgi:hypothetical protein
MRVQLLPDDVIFHTLGDHPRPRLRPRSTVERTIIASRLLVICATTKSRRLPMTPPERQLARGDAMRIEPAALAKAIGTLDAIDLDRGWSEACCR